MKFTRLSNMFRTRRSRIILAVAILAVIVGGYFLTKGNKPVVETPIPGKKYYSQLTGNEVSKDKSDRPILAIMIENSEEARPQTGLDDAGIVFETVTEAGITRYLTMFQESLPETVGPVRSVRPYFVDWLMGFDASVAHVGGSATALEMIEQRKAKSLNEFYNETAYYRNPDREAPHDAYTHPKDLVALQDKLGHKTSKVKEIPRSDDAPSTTPTAGTITVNYSEPIFQAQFKYDPATNLYTRSLAGTPHIDTNTNKPVTVKNLIVIKMSGEIEALSSGKAVLFKDGGSREINWRQKDYDNRIELTDDTGNEVPLNRGDSWFAVIPGTGSVSF